MEKYDRIISWIWILLGIGLCIESSIIGLGSVSEPGTGFMSFVVGLVIIILAILMRFEFTKGERGGPARRISLWSNTDWKRVIYIIVLLLVYILSLPKLGYLIATFLVLVLLLKSGEPVKWPAAIILGILASAISYLIFGVWLHVSLPRGILYF